MGLACGCHMQWRWSTTTAHRACSARAQGEGGPPPRQRAGHRAAACTPKSITHMNESVRSEQSPLFRSVGHPSAHAITTTDMDDDIVTGATPFTAVHLPRTSERVGVNISALGYVMCFTNAYTHTHNIACCPIHSMLQVVVHSVECQAFWPDCTVERVDTCVRKSRESHPASPPLLHHRPEGGGSGNTL